MNRELLNIALCIDSHPVLKEGKEYKEEYIGILKYFTDKYSNNDIFAERILDVYREKFLLSEESTCHVDNISKSIKRVGKNKVRKFKLISYRYNLIYDCLFINAFHRNDIALAIIEEVKGLFQKKYHNKIQQLFDVLFGESESFECSLLDKQIKLWKDNLRFVSQPLNKVLITANMSAGKSTLINTIVGKRINKTKNDVCTEKIHYIFNKPFEDGLSYELDYSLNLDADLNTLMEDNPENKDNEICVGTFFRAKASSKKRLCIIDTPGVNSSLDEQHREMSYKVIKENDYNSLVCVLNASNIGTFDDKRLLQYLLDTVKNKEIIFVINQFDKFDKDEDSIEECVNHVQEEIDTLGFKNAVICPVSAYAGMLAKKCIYGEGLSDVEKLELQMLMLKFRDSKSIMEQFFLYREDSKQDSEKPLEKQCIDLLYNSGVLNLERILFEGRV